MAVRGRERRGGGARGKRREAERRRARGRSRSAESAAQQRAQAKGEEKGRHARKACTARARLDDGVGVAVAEQVLRSQALRAHEADRQDADGAGRLRAAGHELKLKGRFVAAAAAAAWKQR